MEYQATAAQISPVLQTRAEDRWFYVSTAIAGIITVVVGFGPSLVNTGPRKAPLTPLVAVHGIVCVAWLLLFLAQTTLVATRRLRLHRRLGIAAGFLAAALIVSGYMTSIAMARRGFDLSGDLHAQLDPLALLVFPLGDLVTFGALLAAGYLYRRRGDIHKRLMLLAMLGGLMPAPLAHLIGHFALRPSIILVPIAGFLFARAAYDRYALGRVHPVSLWGAVAIFVFGNLRATLIGPSVPWHHFAAWLVR